jgi:ribosomal protein S18 acetylase RimI-like enzyme
MPAMSHEQPRIRTVQASDRPAIMQMLRNLPAFLPHEVVVAAEVLDSCLADPLRSGYYAFVAELGTQAVGYVCYGPVPLCEGTWDIYWIAADAAFQARGIGSALLRSAEQHIRACSGRMIMAETSSRAEYAAAQHLYVSQGYALVSDIADFYAPGDSRLIFCKRLT